MDNKYTNGVILKRKFADFQEVEIVGTLDEQTIVKDTNGRHYIETKKLPDYFDIVEPETIVNKFFNHQNNDDPTRHNVAGTMNGPSQMQEHAFKKQEGE